MSPEQATGRDVDGRSDMFSLGAVLYELVCGRRPFGGDNAAQLVEAILHDEIPPFQPLGTRSASAGGRARVRRMLEKDPASRYAGLGEVAEALATPRRRRAARRLGPARDGQSSP